VIARRHSQRGMTLIEIMVVLAIMALVMLGAVSAVRRARESDLREDGARLAAALRFAYDRATATGEHHRVTIDLDEEAFIVERCEGKIRLARSLDEAQKAEKDRLLEQERQIQKMGATTPEQQAAIDALPVPEPIPTVGNASCQPVKGQQGKVQELRRKLGIRISKVYVGHLDSAATDGRASINFFPLGRAERAVIEISDDKGTTYSVVVHSLTGRVRLRPGEWPRPEEFITTDAEGEELEDD
jgi:prepilin-type N-terminal cleavage/methylation domain-containing protein